LLDNDRVDDNVREGDRQFREGDEGAGGERGER